MMNLAMKAGMNQMKGQAQSLIQSEMQDKGLGNNDPKEENIEVNNTGKQIQPKKKKKPKIDRNLTVRMYSILFFHTLVITVLLYVFHFTDTSIEKKSDNFKGANPLMSWIIFFGCIVLSIILSFLVSKVKCVSKFFLNYFFYIILLALNAFAFVWGGKDKLFHYIVSMLIMFDAGSLTVLFFSLLVKDIPSTFWIMCSCSGGLIIALLVLIKVFDEDKYLVLLICALSFAIYEVMNYNALDSYKNNNKNNNSIPSMMSLPFELNISFVKLIYYFFYMIFSWFKACCCSSKKKK